MKSQLNSVSLLRILPGLGTQNHQQFGPDSGGWCTQSQSQWSCGPVEEGERRLVQTLGRAHLSRARTGLLLWLRCGCGWPRRWRVGNTFTLTLRNVQTKTTHDAIICAWLWSRWQDIVVGAPQFYMKDGDVGGAVYVYVNQEGRWDGVTPVRLDGTKDSMFGLAVENIGDVNQDSFEGN